MSRPDHSPVTEDAPASATQTVLEYLRTLVSVVVVVLVVRTFLFESFVIPSGSMIPTLQVGDYIWVSKYTYGYSRFSLPFSPDLFAGRIWGAEPHRGDVVVFRFTKDTSVDYVKRIIGLPGDHVQVTDGHLYLNGQMVPCTEPHPYVARDETGTALEGEACTEQVPGSAGAATVSHGILKLTDDGPQNGTPDYVVPPGYFFAMGDNRDDSADSRFMGDGPKDLGFVPMENLVGKAQRVFFSVTAEHPLWQVWYWPAEIRWNRLMRGIQ
ncbi:signal peptidase I [Acetobacter sp. TBRC 12305]|uniref:Signal peptidase I n=1 Tax=Acetobacter garciniae TaxID=2817435 RepID=A0A939KP96_9PROT|nr:signal peptidase I [Acetobacter garciniae]MBO1323664.1 signal peptidase I [Acetobacter garciniae]MBX0343353.1 signal peptidase I [Acetobacter garciniae]